MQDFIESSMPEAGATLESGHSLPLRRVMNESFSDSKQKKLSVSFFSNGVDNLFPAVMLQKGNEVACARLNVLIVQQGMPKIVHTDLIQTMGVKLVGSPTLADP
ncbi:MAG TPA: hypothetical protein PLD88_09860, partial [Candidatus Berkiella sp.]|nr:hypothetical protein [Candidatus Berkiella sp.]